MSSRGSVSGGIQDAMLSLSFSVGAPCSISTGPVQPTVARVGSQQ